MYDSLITHYTERFGQRIDQAKEARAVLLRATWQDAADRVAALAEANGIPVVRRGSKEWHYATPLANHTRYFRPGDGLPAPERLPENFTIVAADGSQIFPDPRDAYPFAMVRIATVAVDYGSGERPIFSELMIGPDDEAVLAILAGDLSLPEMRSAIGGLRDRLELKAAANAAAGTPGAVVMVDGPLHLYEADDAVQRSHNAAIASVIENGSVPVGIISRGDARYCVRLAGLLANIDSDDQWPHISDWHLWGHLLASERSPVFGLASGYNQAATVPIAFFYLNVGEGVVRVELPAECTPNEVIRLAAIIVAESQHLGYPYGLIRAHELTVIRGPERRAYVQQFEAALANAGLYDHNRSVKEMLKSDV